MQPTVYYYDIRANARISLILFTTNSRVVYELYNIEKRRVLVEYVWCEHDKVMEIVCLKQSP